MRRGIAFATALLALPLIAVAANGDPVRYELDAGKSRFTFRIAKFFGSALHGEFGKSQGYLISNAAGPRKAVITLSTDTIDVNDGNRILSRIARSNGFFATATYPSIIFESEWNDRDLLRRGGSIRGFVTIRGVRNAETFRITPAKCSNPGIDCAVEVKGSVNRTTYGVGPTNHALAPEVELTMKIQFQRIL